ncbi:MAG: hypothetical protein Fues2KO_35790 [Fuerstiella sp.]
MIRCAAARALLCVTVPAMLLTPLSAKAESNNATRNAVVERVGQDIRYLASKELEGRGVETKGIHLAADHMIEAFEAAGLKPGMPDGTWKQPFEITLGKTQIDDRTALKFTDADGNERNIAVGTFQPIQRGTSGSAEGEMVFVGYGITSEDDQYDEYADVDVSGKILLMIRREPRQGQDGDAFEGKETSSHSYIDRKLSLAKQNGAAGIVFVNDPYTATTPSKDELVTSSMFGAEDSGLPFVHVRLSIIDSLLEAHPLTADVDGESVQLKSVREAAELIDKTLKPISQRVEGWTAEVSTVFDSKSVEAHNVIGVLEGSGELAEETIIIGGHYDHLGYGGYGSKDKSRTGEIHFGADDNATGTAAVMEMARRLGADKNNHRRLVFIGFSGEERGLLGSRHYVSEPVFPLDKTVAMLNFDMIGTLRNNRIDVNGVGTAKEFGPIVEAADEASSLDIRVIEHPYAGSDHLPFFQKNIPVMFSFTGVTPRYHTPDDTFEVINVEGVVDVIDFTEHMLRAIDALPEAPEFQAVSRSRRRPAKIPYLGVIPNLGTDADEPGVPIQSVRAGSPAKAAGLQTADVILKANGTVIDGHPELVQFIKGRAQGSEVVLLVQRDGDEVEIKVTLGAPR